jgi:hypothetical protein
LADFAALANVREVMPVHLHPRRTQQGLITVADTMRARCPRVSLPHEGKRYPIRRD